jgi:hypothetical protein
MKILEFRYLTTADSCDLQWFWCSRVYEYPIVLNFLESIRTPEMTIHNTAAGWDVGLTALQRLFFSELNRHGFNNVRHSDMEATPKEGINKFNIFSDRDEMQYDVVLNISTIEHMPIEEQIPSLNNLLSNVKPNGYLVLTFDLPDVNLPMIENWCGRQCDPKPENALNGLNSQYSQPQYESYNFILLIIQKNQ